MCKAYGFYATYLYGCLPPSLIEELYQLLPPAAQAPSFMSKAGSLFSVRVRRQNFIKLTTVRQSLASYALHYMAYHAWLLQQRRAMTCTTDTNLIMCPELIIMMSRSRHRDCASCVLTSSSSQIEGAISFRGQSTALTGVAEAPWETPSLAREVHYTQHSITKLSVFSSHGLLEQDYVNSTAFPPWEGS